MDDRMPQIIAECIDAIQSGYHTVDELLEQYPEYGSELKPILETVHSIRQSPVVSPRPEFIVGAKYRLIRQLADHPAAVVQPQSRSKQHTRTFQQNSHRLSIGMAGLLAAIIVVTTGWGTAYASNSAIPGDTLYPVKTQIESMRLGMAVGTHAIDLELEFTNRRAVEIDQLVSLGRFDQIPAEVNAMNSSLRDAEIRIGQLPDENKGQHDAYLDKIDGSAAHNVTVLRRVLEKAPDTAKPAISHAIDETVKKHPKAAENPSAAITQSATPDATEAPSATPKHRQTQPVAADTAQPIRATDTVAPKATPDHGAGNQPVDHPTQSQGNNPIEHPTHSAANNSTGQEPGNPPDQPPPPKSSNKPDTPPGQQKKTMSPQSAPSNQ